MLTIAVAACLALDINAVAAGAKFDVFRRAPLRMGKAP
jgi:uncharacterized OsmC-like protein